MIALFQRDDFPELVERVASVLGVNPAIVEKDYFVTEALRQIAEKYGPDIMFKGGTSLSKGWNLIARFSEDIDLYIEPGTRGNKARNTLLKSVIATAAKHSAFVHPPIPIGIVSGVARSVRLEYRSSQNPPSLPTSVLIELGIQSGTFPSEIRPIQSMVSAALVAAGTAPNQVDCQPFDLRLLHFRRTFVEKMFALHDKVARGVIGNGTPIGGYARHYYDLSQLVVKEEVREMLRSGEYAEIATDYHRLTTQYFPNQAFPDRLNLADSPALFPPVPLRSALARDYREQCETLCYGPYPVFEDILRGFEEIRPFLTPAVKS